MTSFVNIHYLYIDFGVFGIHVDSRSVIKAGVPGSSTIVICHLHSLKSNSSTANTIEDS